jgi:hypothetical protein
MTAPDIRLLLFDVAGGRLRQTAACWRGGLFGWPHQVLILVFSRITQVKAPITTL